MYIMENRMNTEVKIETNRLYMREMRQSDYSSLCKMLKDGDVMYAYEGAFDDEMAHDWLDRQLSRYREYGLGLWAVILKESGEMIDQCGLTYQNWKGERLLEIGYLFMKEFWHMGYATESAEGCKNYAFTELGAEKVCSIIRDTNIPSQNVALRNGMKPIDTWVKHYRGVDMPHILYSANK